MSRATINPVYLPKAIGRKKVLGEGAVKMGIAGDSMQSIDRARQLLGENKPGEAEPILRALLEILPNDAETNALQGASLSMLGRTAESIEFVERAVGLEPNKAS